MSFPLPLIAPEVPEPIWKDYLQALDAFQHAVIHHPDDAVNHLRITRATVPLESAPPIYSGPHAGFPVAKGNAFAVRLSNGLTINE